HRRPECGDQGRHARPGCAWPLPAWGPRACRVEWAAVPGNRRPCARSPPPRTRGRGMGRGAAVVRPSGTHRRLPPIRPPPGGSRRHSLSRGVEKATEVTTEDTIALGGPTGHGGLERYLHEQRRGRGGEVDLSPRVCHAFPPRAEGGVMVLIAVRGFSWQPEPVTTRSKPAPSRQHSRCHPAERALPCACAWERSGVGVRLWPTQG